ncbi:MAG: hypothetical protein WAT79_10865, partial [Saprospiraceae bacterium]
MTIKLMKVGLSLILVLTNIMCSKNNQVADTMPVKVVKAGQLDYWLTKGDQSILFEKQKPLDFFTGSINNYPTIEIDTVSTFQSVDGFGYTLTGGSAGLIHKMGAFQKNSLLNDLFLCNNNSLCISYLRISLGASDLDDAVFSYNDIDVNSEDTALSAFSLSRDTMALIPVLKEILKINPSIKIMASPW